MKTRNRTFAFTPVVFVAAALGACSPVETPAPPIDYSVPGPSAVGHVRTVIIDRGGTRHLPVEIWYPAARSTADGGVPAQAIEDFEPPGADHDALVAMLATTPPDCTRRRMSALPDAAPLDGTWPLVIFSHCSECVRFSSYSIAERLAARGIAVAAPDHLGNTVYASDATLDEAHLAIRAADVSSVIDALLDGARAEVPAMLRGRFRADRVGVMGHSFGGATVGRVLGTDARVLAGLSIAAPMDSPLLDPGGLDKIKQPTLFLLAVEDNSILAIGNYYLRDNASLAPTPSWLVEVADAGHWSFSDIAGLGGRFLAGCGMGMRQTKPSETFTYLDNTKARDIASVYADAFFGRFLAGDESASAFLDSAAVSPSAKATARH